MNKDISQDDIDIMIDSMLNKNGNHLYSHLFDSYHTFIDNIIRYSLESQHNSFFETINDNIIYTHRFIVKNIRYKEPTYNGKPIFPQDARIKQLNYFFNVEADIQQVVKIENLLQNTPPIIKNVGNEVKNITIAKVPIMVKSKYCSTNIYNKLENECKYEPGGYFIVNGGEKVIISLEIMAVNKTLVYSKKDLTYEDGKYFSAQINSRVNDWSDNLQIVTIKHLKDNSLVIKNSQFNEFPLIILFRAYGIETDDDILNMITLDKSDKRMRNYLRKSLIECKDMSGNIIRTREEAINYLISKLKYNRRINNVDEKIIETQKKIYLNKILEHDTLPHLGISKLKKIKYIAYMVRKLLNVILGRQKKDNRDSFYNKRIETPGVLLGQIFRQNWKKMLSDIGNKFFRKKMAGKDHSKPIEVVNHIKPKIIEHGIKTSMATGNWGFHKSKKGVSQSMLRKSWFDTTSELRRIMAPSSDAATSSITSMREIDNSQLGFICPIESPEGQNVGFKKHLTMQSTITVQNIIQKDIIISILEKETKSLECYEIDDLELKYYTKIFINGDWVGNVLNGIEVYNMLKNKRITGLIDKFTSISFNFNDNCIEIWCDGGRLIRPLLKVKDNNILVTKNIINDLKKIIKENKVENSWIKLLSKYPNIVEYEDIESTKHLMIAEKYKVLLKNKEKESKNITNINIKHINKFNENKYVEYTHCELHPWLMYGNIISSVPFVNNTNQTRYIIFFAQAKQAVGVYATNYKDRVDLGHILYQPQVPLVTTKGMKYNKTIKLPFGENVIIAVMSYTGFNQEDSIIMNRSAIDRGLFASENYKKYQSVITKNPTTSQDDEFTKPDRNKVAGMKQGNYNKLNDKGYVDEETEVLNGDILIGKISPILPTGNNNKIYKDNSEIFKQYVPGIVDKVYTGIYNSDGYEIYNMKVRMERKPIVGDKFSTRHGQKGTIGLILEQKDMPFTKEGIVPDIIMNPHSYPSRMSIGQIAEGLGGKIGAIMGKHIDGTPFYDYDITKMPEMLEKLGYEKFGNETLYCGMTGKKIKTDIYITPIYTVRLKHMTLDKIHARAEGPTQGLTRQPLEGRARNGGLRIGEMEKDAIVAHGTSQFLKEKFLECSDIYKTYVCNTCGMLATKVPEKDYWICMNDDCNENPNISSVVLPYSCKLLFQELMSVNIKPMIKTKNNIYIDNA